MTIKHKFIIFEPTTAGLAGLLMKKIDEKRAGPFYLTSSVDFVKAEYTIGSDTVCAQVWHTAGQEKINTVSPAYIKGFDGILLLANLSDPDAVCDLNKKLKFLTDSKIAPPITLLLLQTDDAGMSAELFKSVNDRVTVHEKVIHSHKDAINALQTISQRLLFGSTATATSTSLPAAAAGVLAPRAVESRKGNTEHVPRF
jgi:GTPase SAR1 family protein